MFIILLSGDGNFRKSTNKNQSCISQKALFIIILIIIENKSYYFMALITRIIIGYKILY